MTETQKRGRALFRACCGGLAISMLCAAMMLTWVAQAPARPLEMPRVAMTSVPDSDACLFILQPVAGQSAAEARAWKHRQDAGSAAAMGLVFGVRYAVGPAEVTSLRDYRQPASFRAWEARDQSQNARALAIADYRACRNEQSLQILTD